MAKKPTQPQTQSHHDSPTTLGGKEVKEILALERGPESDHINSRAPSAPGGDPSNPEPGTTTTEVIVAAKLSPTERKQFAKLRHEIQEGLSEMHSRFVQVGKALLEIREKKLFRGKYKNFIEFCEEEFNIAKTRAYELAGAAEIMRDFSAVAEFSTVPTNERQMRPLTALKEPEQRKVAWQKALSLAGDKPVVESDVRKAVAEVKGGGKPKEVADVANSEDQASAWKNRIREAFKKGGYEDVFEQPLAWAATGVDLYSKASKRHVKIIYTLSFDEVCIVVALKEIDANAVIIVNADANSPHGLLFSKSENPTSAEIIDSFTRPFNFIAISLGALLEDEGTFYKPGTPDARYHVSWLPIPEGDFAGLGLLTNAAAEVGAHSDAKEELEPALAE
jgi:hypothetical protein